MTLALLAYPDILAADDHHFFRSRSGGGGGSSIDYHDIGQVLEFWLTCFGVFFCPALGLLCIAQKLVFGLIGELLVGLGKFAAAWRLILLGLAAAVPALLIWLVAAVEDATPGNSPLMAGLTTIFMFFMIGIIFFGLASVLISAAGPQPWRLRTAAVMSVLAALAIIASLPRSLESIALAAGLWLALLLAVWLSGVIYSRFNAWLIWRRDSALDSALPRPWRPGLWGLIVFLAVMIAGLLLDESTAAGLFIILLLTALAFFILSRLADWLIRRISRTVEAARAKSIQAIEAGRAARDGLSSLKNFGRKSGEAAGSDPGD